MAVSVCSATSTGDLLLEQADVVLTIGYDPIEYDPKFWNVNGDRTIIHLDEIIADIDHAYQPDLELIGDIPSTINHIEHDAVKVEFAEREQKILSDLKQYMHEGEQVALQIGNQTERTLLKSLKSCVMQSMIMLQ